MRAFLESILLGFLQGVTEFLPVSSSGHLTLTKLFFQTESFFLLTLTVHFGTFVSLVIFYRRELFFMAQDVYQNPLKSLVVKVFFGSLPVLTVGFFFYEEIKEIFNHLHLVAVGFLITASLLSSTYWFRKEKIKNLEQISYLQAFGIGVVQVLALIPGVSRSGSTISVAIYLGFSPSLAVSFSFLLALPALFIACVYEFFKTNWSVELLAPFLGSFFSSFLFGYMALIFMKKASDHLYKFSFYLFPLSFFLFIYSSY